MPLSQKASGPSPGSLLAWQILAPIAAVFAVLLLIAALAARHYFDPNAIQRDLTDAQHDANLAAALLATSPSSTTPEQLTRDLREAGLDTLEFLPPGQIPSWASPHHMAADSRVEAWAPVVSAGGPPRGAVSLRREAEATTFATKTIRAFAVATCATFALLLAIAWVLFKRRVTDRLDAVIREVGPVPHSESGESDAVERTRKTIVQALAAAKTSEAHLSLLLDGHSELVCVETPEGRLIDANSAFCRLFGKKREELVGTSSLDLVHPAYRMEVVSHLRAASRAGLEAGTAHAVVSGDGGTSWVKWHTIAVAGPDGRTKEIISFRTDITAQRNAEERMESLRRAFEQMQSLAETGSLTWDFAHDLMEWTPETRRLLGIEAPVAASFDGFLAVISPEDREMMRQLFRSALDEGREFQQEFRAVLPDGSLRVLQGRAEVLADPRTKLLTLLTCTLRDITSLRDAEAATKRELHFRTAIEQSLTSAFTAISDDGRIIYANPAFYDQTGWPESEVLGILPPYPWWPDDDDQKEAIAQALQMAIHGDSPNEGFELQFKRRDGKLYDVLIRVAPLIGEANERIGWLSSITDVSPIQNTRRELQKAEATVKRELRFREAIEQSLASGIVVSDTAGKNLLVNPAFCEMTGWTADELIGKSPPYPYWPEDETPVIRAAFEQALRGETPREGVELRFCRQDGSLFDVLIKVAPLLDNEDRQLGWLAAVSDISSIQRTRRELAQAGQELREQLAYREAVDKSTTVGLVAIGADGRPLSVNDAYSKMLGFSREEIFAWKPPYPCWPEEEQEEIRRAFALHLEGKAPPDGFQVRLLKKDRQAIDVLITASPITGPDGKQMGVLSAITDITPLQQARRELLESNERMKIAEDVVGLGIWDWRPETDTLFWDKNSFAMFGHPEATSPKDVWAAVHSEEMRERLTYELHRLMAAGGANGQDRLRIRWPDGTEHNILSTYVILRDKSGKPNRVIGVNRDITAELEQEHELRLAQERLSAALEGGKFGTFEHVFGFGAVNWNAANYEAHGIDPAITDPDELFRAWKTLVGDGYAAIEQAVASLPVDRTSVTYDFDIQIPCSGEKRRIRSSVFVERNKHGHPVRLVGVSRRLD